MYIKLRLMLLGCALSVASLAQGAPKISAPDAVLLADTPNQWVPLLVTPGPEGALTNVQAANITVQMAAGTTVEELEVYNGQVPYLHMGTYTSYSEASFWAGLPQPPSPTLWDEAYAGLDPYLGVDQDEGPAKADDFLHAWEGRDPVVGGMSDPNLVENALATADGVLAWLLVDTTGITYGSWPLMLTATANDDTVLGLAVPKTGPGAVGYDLVIADAEVQSGSITVTVLGDADLNGEVDGGDLDVLEQGFGKTGDADWRDGDFSGDGCVDHIDYLIFRSLPQTGGSAAPEPASAVLLAVGMLLLVRPARPRRSR